MNDRDYMLMAIELAKKGMGWVNPQPLVGAVIVKNGRIIGQGYHTAYGKLHGERGALASLVEDAHGAVMYVTLEPCCHYGKQPPCTLAIIESGIKKVVVGSDDPNPKVAGKGFQQLQEAGIEVVNHFMKEECDVLNLPFFYYMNHKRPYVVVHKGMNQQMRHQYMSILVDVSTVIQKDPSLTCDLDNSRNPIRVVYDENLEIPLDCKVVKSAKEIPTYVAYCHENSKKEHLENCGITLLKCKNLNELMDQLGTLKIDSILIEEEFKDCLSIAQEVHGY